MNGIALLVMLLSTALTQAEGVIVKQYGKKHKIGGMFFNAIICAFAAVFFIVKETVIKRGIEGPAALVPY